MSHTLQTCVDIFPPFSTGFSNLLQPLCEREIFILVFFSLNKLHKLNDCCSFGFADFVYAS